VSVSKEITRLEKSSVRLTLTVPKDEVASGYRDLLRKYVRDAQIPGFRRGKVPPAVLEMKFGEALKGEALGKIIENSIEGVFGDEGLPQDERPLPYSRPEMEGEPVFDPERDLTFSLVYDVKPRVEIARWKGFEVEVPRSEVTEADVARELEDVRDRNSFVMDREDGAAARDGDIVTISYRALDGNGEAVEGSGRDDMAYTLASGDGAPEFDPEIVGMARGETKEFAGPDGGRTRLTLVALKEKRLPELDDELAQDVDEKFATLDDLRKNARERLEARLNGRLRELRISRLMDRIMEGVPIELPESMVRAEIGGRIGSLGRTFGMTPEALVRMMAEAGNGVENAWRPAAEKSLRSNLVMDAIMRDNPIEVGDDEIEAEIATATADSEDPAGDALRLREEDGLRYVRHEIMERKLLDALFAENTFREGPELSYLDLMADNG
jgi:trigger factor